MKNYDLVVIGGGTAGCAAAYIASKLGLKTLLLERNIHLGGTITSGLVVPVMNAGENQINTDFYNALISEMQSIGAQVTYHGNPGWFNPELLKIVLDKMMKDVNVDIVFNCEVSGVNIQNNTITGIEIKKKILSPYIEQVHTNNTTIHRKDILSVPIETRYVLDATGNCDFCKKIQCEFLNDSDEFQPMSLRFMMGGVDVEKFANWIADYDNDREVTTVQKTPEGVHFSTAYTWDKSKNWALAPLFDNAVKENLLKDTDRNYFQVFTVAGMPSTVAFNCPRIVENLNPNDVFDRTTALISARESIFRLSNFCKKYLPGFENSYISNIADDLGVRVSNRIRGKYVYTIEDLREGKKFENPVVISNYPVDVHSAEKDSSTLAKTGEYQLPIESLMVAGYDNLFVAGRALSADFMAQGALRVQSSCFAMGEGVAKYIKTLIN